MWGSRIMSAYFDGRSVAIFELKNRGVEYM